MVSRELNRLWTLSRVIKDAAPCIHTWMCACTLTHTHTCKLFKTRTFLCLLLQSHCLPQMYCAVLTVTQLGLSLSNTIDCGSPGSSVHGVLRQEYWRGLPCPSPGYLSHPGSEPTSRSPALAGRFFTTSTSWEALRGTEHKQKSLLKRVCLMKQRDSGFRWLDSVLVQLISSCKLRSVVVNFTFLPLCFLIWTMEQMKRDLPFRIAVRTVFVKTE